MGLRKVNFANGEFYHVFNRGIDKRDIFVSKADITRFSRSMKEFNTVDPIGSIHEASYERKLGSSTPKLKQDNIVDFICYCLNPNHYHFILKQVEDRGVERLMQRLGTGYTNYFNKKHERSGSLFQGRFKAVHVESNEQLLHLSVYINLNQKVHKLGSSTSKSSWGEYINEGDDGFCDKSIILEQFKDRLEYKKFAEGSLEQIIKRKDLLKGL